VTIPAPGLSVAMSFMILPGDKYNEDVCSNAPIKSTLPLTAFDWTYYYSGRGLIPQGYDDPVKQADSLSNFIKRSKNKTSINFATFKHYFKLNCRAPRPVRKDQLRIHSPQKAFVSFIEGHGTEVTEKLLKERLTLEHVSKASQNTMMQLVFGLDEGIEEVTYGDHFEYDFMPDSYHTRAEGHIQEALRKEVIPDGHDEV